jgi:ribonuclease D
VFDLQAADPLAHVGDSAAQNACLRDVLERQGVSTEGMVKDEQQADWSIRKLSTSALQYAAWDTKFLPTAYRNLTQSGKWTAEDTSEVMQRSADIVAKSVESADTVNKLTDAPIRLLKSATQELLYIELSKWRLEQWRGNKNRKEYRWIGNVMRNADMYSLSRCAPDATPAAMASCIKHKTPLLRNSWPAITEIVRGGKFLIIINNN